MAGPVKFSQKLAVSRTTPKLRDGQLSPFLHSIYMREWIWEREWECVPQAVWALAGLGGAFWITLRSSLERQVFDGGLRPIQLFVNTTISYPQQKMESTSHILFLLGGVSRISPCPAVCLPRVYRRFGHRFFVPSRAMSHFLFPYPEMNFRFLEAYIVMCWERKAGSRATLAGEKGGTGK